MRGLENFMNALSDMDWGWWPVRFLRPPKNKDIDNLVLLKLTFFFGPVMGLAVFLLRLGRMEKVTPGGVAAYFLFGCVLFFVFYKFTFAYFWNRRARRLRADESRNETAA